MLLTRISYHPDMQRYVEEELKRGVANFDFELQEASFNIEAVESLLQGFKRVQPSSDPLTINLNLRDSKIQQHDVITFADKLTEVQWPMGSQITISLKMNFLRDRETQYLIKSCKNSLAENHIKCEINLQDNILTKQTKDYTFSIMNDAEIIDNSISDNYMSVKFSDDIMPLGLV